MPQIEHNNPENNARKFETKDMCGSLFINRTKTKENSPDMAGEVKIAGHTYRIAAWNKTSKSGMMFLSLNFSEPRERAGQSGQVTDLKHPETSVASLLQELAAIKSGAKNDTVPF